MINKTTLMHRALDKITRITPTLRARCSVIHGGTGAYIWSSSVYRGYFTKYFGILAGRSMSSSRLTPT